MLQSARLTMAVVPGGDASCCADVSALLLRGVLCEKC